MVLALLWCSPLTITTLQFGAEFRRVSINRSELPINFRSFYDFLEKLHGLGDMFFTISYAGKGKEQLPINNDSNLAFALANVTTILRLLVQREGESILELNGYGKTPRRARLDVINSLLRSDCTSPAKSAPSLLIGPPCDFQHLSSVVDVHLVPPTQRRVRLMCPGNDGRHLGIYIRDSEADVRRKDFRGVFISRLLPGSIAAGTGLLAVGDEVLEVNGIEVFEKTLGQVSDMMTANSLNLMLTIRPANQRNNLVSKSPLDGASMRSRVLLVASQHGVDDENGTGSDVDEDLVRDYVTSSRDNGQRMSGETEALAWGDQVLRV